MRLIYLYAAAALFQFAAYLWFVNDPLFGDAISSTYYAANHIYTNNLLTLFYGPEVDPGHPTLYAWLLAGCWKIFGQSLSVSHAFSACWMFGFTGVFLVLANRMLYQHYVALAAGTLVLFSTYLSLSAMVLNTSMLVFLVLLSAYAIIIQNRFLLVLANCLMVCVHLQGTFFVLANVCAIFCINFGVVGILHTVKRYLFAFLLPLLLFACWLLLHKSHTGWYLQSPHYTDLEKHTTVLGTALNVLRILWRLADFGMLPVHALAVLAIVRKRAHKSLGVVYISYLAINATIMLLVLHATIAHRYFFPIHALAIILAYQYVSSMSGKWQVALSLFTVTAVISGNFLYYPGKTIGDATLAYRNYFDLEKTIVHDLAYTYSLKSLAPIGNTTRSKYLDNRYRDIKRLDLAKLNDADVVLQSNINAEFDQATIRFLQNNWYGTTYASGPVYVNVYLNPLRTKVKPEGWALRKPDFIEKQVIKLKDVFR
jgi:hypothetical protein